MKQIQRMTTALCLPLGAFLCLAGCTTMAPKYTQPAAPVPAAWPSGPAYQGGDRRGVAKPVADIPWQEFFVDPQLRKLIALALENNRDLRVAVLNIERSRAQYQIQRSDLFPKVDATAGANFQRIPEDFSGTGMPMTIHQYSVGLGVSSYELDLFGRVRSLKDQALEQYLATEQARRSVQISLVSQVAATYLTLAADRERLQLAKETLASQQSSYQLTQSRFEAGVSSALDLHQAQTSVDTARVDIARYTTLVAQDENALNLVVGSPVPADLLPAVALRNAHRPEGSGPRPAVRRAAPPPRHPPGRKSAQGGQCQHRRGAGGVLPPHHPGLVRRLRQRRPGRALQVAAPLSGNSHRRSPCPSSTAAATGPI